MSPPLTEQEAKLALAIAAAYGEFREVGGFAPVRHVSELVRAHVEAETAALVKERDALRATLNDIRRVAVAEFGVRDATRRLGEMATACLAASGSAPAQKGQTP